MAIAYQIAAQLRLWREAQPEWRLPELVAQLQMCIRDRSIYCQYCFESVCIKQKCVVSEIPENSILFDRAFCWPFYNRADVIPA